MRVEPLTTILPVDTNIEFDEGLQRVLRQQHQLNVGQEHFNQFGGTAGANENHADFFLQNKIAYWMKTDLLRFSQPELAALRGARLAARQYVREGGQDNSLALRECMDHLKKTMLWDAMAEIEEEEAKQREALESEDE